jgi:hydroxylamine reductase
MFCYQCEQAAKGEGCIKMGVCGKEPDIAALQDLLIHVLQGVSQVAIEGRKNGFSDPEVNLFVCEGTFSTLTNVNFDADRFTALINKGVALRESLKAKVEQAGKNMHLPDEMRISFL